MRKHRSFCLPESEQASRQARQEPDGTTVGARDDGLSGSGTDGRISVERQHTSDVRAGPAEGAWVTEWRRRDWSRERRRDLNGLGAVGGNPVAATEELKPLEHLGPAQQGAE